MATVTNQVAAPALRGQGVKVTLSSAQTSVLSTLKVGTTCTAATSLNKGIVASVDVFGNSFIVNPVSPAGSFSGSAAGQLAASVVITY